MWDDEDTLTGYADADIEAMEMADFANEQDERCEDGDHGGYRYTNRVTGVESCRFCGRDIG